MLSPQIASPVSPVIKSNPEFDLYSELKRPTNHSDFKQKIRQIVNDMGFSDYTFIPLNRDWENEDDQRLLSTYPEQYWEIYQQENLYLHDMLVSYAKINTHPIFASQVYDYYCNAPFDTESSYKNLMIRQLECSFGVFDRYAIPIINSDGKSKFLFILSQHNIGIPAFKEKIDSMGTILRLLGQAVYTVSTDKFPTLIERPPPQVITKQLPRGAQYQVVTEQPLFPVVTITARQLRVLDTLANNDLPMYLVADMLCISPVTAHQHIAFARKALNKKTNSGAIKEAIRLGLISYN